MDETLIALLVCPRCKAALAWRPSVQELVCPRERLAFPVREGVPVLLIDEARAGVEPEEAR